MSRIRITTSSLATKRAMAASSAPTRRTKTPSAPPCSSSRWPPATRSTARRSATASMRSTVYMDTTTTPRPRTSSRASRAKRRLPPSWIPYADSRLIPILSTSPQRYSTSPRVSQTCRRRTCSSTSSPTAPGLPSAPPAPSPSSNSTARWSRRTRARQRQSSRRYERILSKSLICKRELGRGVLIPVDVV